MEKSKVVDKLFIKIVLMIDFHAFLSHLNINHH